MDVIVGGQKLPAIEVVWSTSCSAKAGQIEAEIVKCEAEIELGMKVELVDDVEGSFFSGFVFETEENSETIIITAYDQIRYLMFKDSYMIEGMNVGDILSMIAKDMGLSIGKVHSSSALIDLAIIDKKLIDIVFQAMDIHERITGEKLFLWDDIGAICLGKAGDLQSGIMLSGESALLEYRNSQSIDQDTYNRVKLAKNSKKKGLRTVKIMDESSSSSWGTLQYYKRVDEKTEDAQIDAMAKTILRNKNRIKKKMTLNCIGNVSCRAGASIDWSLQDDASEGIISESRHEWKGGRHTMTLDIEGM